MEGTNSIDKELIGHRLDLGRPELRPILDRYAPRDALIVSGRSDTTSLKEAFVSSGWRVHTCDGPGRRRCPLLRGDRCPLRESADVAVVYADPSLSSGGVALPRLRCAADRASPGIVALEGRVGTQRSNGRQAMIAAISDPRRTVELADLLSRGTPEDES